MPSLRLLFLSVSALWFGGLRLHAEQPTRQEILEWAMTVSVGAEYEENAEVLTRRWVKRPVVSVFGGDERERKTVLGAVAGVNKLLMRAGFGMLVSEKIEDTSATMRVHLLNLAEMPAKAKQLGFKYIEGNWGFFYAKFVENEINEAVVFLAKDKLGNLLQHVAYEEITQAMGLMNDSDAFEESIFYSSESDSGSAAQPSRLDAKLITWFYRHVPPGCSADQFRRIFLRTWENETGDPSEEMTWWWLKQIALRPQASGSPETRRWKTTPLVHIAGGSEAQTKALTEVVRDIDKHLRSAGSALNLTTDATTKGTIRILLLPTEEMPAQAKKFEVDYEANHDGYCYSWATGGSIDSALIFLSSDKLEDAMLRHFGYEQLIRALGLHGACAVFSESIWFLDGLDGGRAAEPSDMDWKMLEWFYRCAPAGAREVQLQDAFKRTWGKK